MGLNAAPPLVETLQDGTISAEKRAWILSLLYSVTGLNDPRYGSALASCEYAEGPWQVMGETSGETPSGGIGFASTGQVSVGKIDANEQQKEQQKLAKKWIEWLQTVKMQMVEDE